MNLSDNLKRLRKENNLSQEDLAEKLGVSRQSVSKWESGVAYPEMEKLIQISKLFDVGINELLNEDINEVKATKQSKANINKYIDDFLSFITKSIDMFINMSFKQKIKLIIEECFISFILFILFLIILILLSNILSNILMFLDYRTIAVIKNIFESIYIILASCLGVIIVLHIFKTRYLDYYEIIDKEEVEEKIEKRVEKEEITNKINIEDKRQKIIIRDSDNSSYRFISGLFKAFLILVKINVFFILVGLACSLVFFTFLLVISFMIIKSGLFFGGILLALISCCILHLIVIYLIFNFIFDRSSKLKLVFITFILSLLSLGLGIGITFIGLSNFEIDRNTLVYEKSIPMEDKLILHDYRNIEFVESDNEDIRIIVNHSKYTNIDIIKYKYEDGDFLYVSEEDSYDGIIDFIKVHKNDINNKKISIYKHYDVKIYTNKENINKLKNNSDI